MRHTDCDTTLPVLVSRVSLRNWKLITLGIAQIARAPPLIFQCNGEQTSNCFGLKRQTGWNWKLSKQSSFLGRNTICHHFLEERGSLCSRCAALRLSDDTSFPSRLIGSCTQTFSETAAWWSLRMRRIKPPEHLGSCSCQGSLITSSTRTRVTTKGLLETLKTLGLGHAAPGVGKTTNCDI